MPILAIDPGSEITGWSVGQPDERSELKLLSCGILKPPKTCESFEERFEWLVLAMDDLIAKKQPEEFVIENPYVGVNAGTIIKLAMVAGAFAAVAALHGLPIYRYEPSKWKMSLGSGNMTKQQVKGALETLGYAFPPDAPLDVTDSGVLLYHHFYTVWHEELKRGE